MCKQAERSRWIPKKLIVLMEQVERQIAERDHHGIPIGSIEDSPLG